MSAPVETGSIRRGRPRSEKAQRAILSAATDLLLERGLDSVSMDAIAERAGVSKATIYRWWPTKETLALDALYLEWTDTSAEPTDTGSLRGDLMAMILYWFGRIEGRPYGRIIGALLTEARTDPAFGDIYRERFIEPRREQVRLVLRRAAARGEIGDEIDAEAVIDLLYGPLYHRLLHGHAPLDEHIVRYVVEMVTDSLTRP